MPKIGDKIVNIKIPIPKADTGDSDVIDLRKRKARDAKVWIHPYTLKHYDNYKYYIPHNCFLLCLGL